MRTICLQLLVVLVLVLNISHECVGAPLLRSSMWDVTKLAITKEKIKAGDAELKPALDKLISEANESLKLDPVSVTQANAVPPSGNKHDYWSVGTYWWPCNWNKSDIPKGCDENTGLPYVRRDGEFSPYRDPACDKQRFGDLISAVSSLTVAYYFTDNEAYAVKSATLVKTWFIDPETKMNPNLNYGQQHPGLNNGSQEGIIDFRLLADPDSIEYIGGLLNGIALLQGSSAWTAVDDQALQAWFKDYQHWLTTATIAVAEEKATNNHGTWFDVQIASIAYYISDFDTLDTLLKAEGTKRIATQVEPDGSMPQEIARTTSFHYSWFALTAFMDVADIGRNRKIDVWNFSTKDNRSIQQAIDFLVPYAIGSKPWPYQQIDPFDGDFFPVFRRASIAYNSSYYENLIKKLSDHSNSRINLLWPKIF